MKIYWTLILLYIAFQYAVLLWKRDKLLETVALALILHTAIISVHYCADNIQDLLPDKLVKDENYDHAAYVIFTISIILAIQFSGFGLRRFLTGPAFIQADFAGLQPLSPVSSRQPSAQAPSQSNVENGDTTSPSSGSVSPHVPADPTTARPQPPQGRPSTSEFRPQRPAQANVRSNLEYGGNLPPSSGPDPPQGPGNAPSARHLPPQLQPTSSEHPPQPPPQSSSQSNAGNGSNLPPAGGTVPSQPPFILVASRPNQTTVEDDNETTSTDSGYGLSQSSADLDPTQVNPQPVENEAGTTPSSGGPSPTQTQVDPDPSRPYQATVEDYEESISTNSRSSSSQSPVDFDPTNLNEPTVENDGETRPPSDGAQSNPAGPSANPHVDGEDINGHTAPETLPPRLRKTSRWNDIRMEKQPPINSEYLDEMQKLDSLQCLLHSYLTEVQNLREDSSIDKETRLSRYGIGIQRLETEIKSELASFDSVSDLEVKVRVQDLKNQVEALVARLSTCTNLEATDNKIYGPFSNVYAASSRLLPTLRGVVRSLTTLSRADSLFSLNNYRKNWEEQAAKICMHLCWTADFADELGEVLCIDAVIRLPANIPPRALPLLREIEIMLKRLVASNTMDARIQVPLVEAETFLKSIGSIIRCLETRIDEYAEHQAAAEYAKTWNKSRLDWQADIDQEIGREPSEARRRRDKKKVRFQEPPAPPESPRTPMNVEV